MNDVNNVYVEKDEFVVTSHFHFMVFALFLAFNSDGKN